MNIYSRVLKAMIKEPCVLCGGVTVIIDVFVPFNSDKQRIVLVSLCEYCFGLPNVYELIETVVENNLSNHKTVN